jgi:hypothetical protein
MNMKLKLPIWIDQNKGLYILVFNLFPSILAFLNPFKNLDFLKSLVIGNMIEAKFFTKDL